MKVFLSYSHIDKEIALSIERILIDAKVDYFRDEKNIEWGSSIKEEVRKGLRDCSHLLVILSPASLKSQWVIFEIATALAKEKSVLPYLVHPSLDLPPFLEGLSYLTSIEDISHFFSPQEKIKNYTILDSIGNLIRGNSSTDSIGFVIAVSNLYALKGVKRLGWSQRGVNYAESVAEHTCLATLLAEIFLPDSIEEPGYNKSDVIRMLILHDLGEAYSIDKPLHEKSPNDFYKSEAMTLETLQSISEQSGVDVSKTSNLFKMFNDHDNVNACIAKDIDTLECFIQLHIYSASSEFKDVAEFKNHLLANVRTSVVKKVISNFERAFSVELPNK